MGIHGLLGQIGHGQRISLAKLSAEYYSKNERPFRLAIDISIWLFQIQSGKGGSNPALRTFYYRLLRLLSLNIHPLFVFDGPNKPLFKRNKKVGGPGVRVASVPEFLAKQLLKQFGFPWHVAPGEAEAECALLQRESIVDAVLSEDVDTLMFGSGVTLRNWTAENSTKSPTHVDLHLADETKAKSGMDRKGMILVALMSGGDYIPEGIPGCGPKVACDAARAGFGRELCALGRSDRIGLAAWKERFLHEIHTNESKYFSRKNKQFAIPEDFPNREVLGFYTHPCVSTPEKLAKLKQELRWDQSIDFAALRSFASDAFDWRCIGGAKKFIKNLAPALLIRELRLEGGKQEQLDVEEQEVKEKHFAQAIHGKRNHNTTDGELEYRITFVPERLVPIDLSLEDEEDEFVPAGGAVDDGSDAESEFMALPSSTPAIADSEAPTSPKKRTFKPFDPAQPEKLWILKPFLQVGCPLLVEDYEASQIDPKEFLKQRRRARAAAKGDSNIHATKAKKSKGKANDMPVNSLMSYARVTKAQSERPLKELNPDANTRSNSQSTNEDRIDDKELAAISNFKMPSTQISSDLLRSRAVQQPERQTIEVLDLATTISVEGKSSTAAVSNQHQRSTASSSRRTQPPQNTFTSSQGRKADVQKTPKRISRKRPSPDLSSPALSQKTITSFYSPSPRKPKELFSQIATKPDVINLISSPSVPLFPRDNAFDGIDSQDAPPTPSPSNTKLQPLRNQDPSRPPARPDFSPGKLPGTVTKRRKKSPLKRWQTEPVLGIEHDDLDSIPGQSPETQEARLVEAIDLLETSPAKSDSSLASPSTFINLRRQSEPHEGGFLREDEDLDATLRPDIRPMTSLHASQSENAALLLNGPFDCPTVALCEAEPTQEFMIRPKPTIKDVASRKPRPMPTVRPTAQPTRRSPRQQAKKKRIELRESLEGAWKTVDAEAIDMTGDGSGWKESGGRAKLTGWRKSGVEVLDLTGA
jgi:holliday junction resolvase YEN1